MGTFETIQIASSEEISSTRQAYYSQAIGAEMIVASCGWSKLAAETFGEEAIIAGEIICDRYWTATQDGRSMITQWHEGERAEEIYYERWEAGIGHRHGWIDAESRKITQTG